NFAKLQHVSRNIKKTEMKNTFLTLSLLFSILTFSQKKANNEDLILFEKAVALQELVNDELERIANPKDTIDITNEEKIKQSFAIDLKENILDKVIENYDELIEKFPKSKLIFRALNNKAFAELEIEDYDEAKMTFLKVLNSKANDKEKGGIGSGIMAEPYANYKNRASKKLAELELQNKNYKEAIKYLDETKKHPYRHFCGNEYAADEIYMAEMYSKCYLGMNEYEKAYDILLPNILENGLADNSNLIDTAFNALLKKYKKEDLKVQLEISFSNVTTEKEIRNKNEYTFYYINFLNRKIQLSSWNLFELLSEQERQNAIKQILIESKFYKLLTQ
ncbi:tetratricopeptide repeat protein, partial [Flavobacterium suncheonense]